MMTAAPPPLPPNDQGECDKVIAMLEEHMNRPRPGPKKKATTAPKATPIPDTDTAVALVSSAAKPPTTPSKIPVAIKLPALVRPAAGGDQENVQPRPLLIPPPARGRGRPKKNVAMTAPPQPITALFKAQKRAGPTTTVQ